MIISGSGSYLCTLRTYSGGIGPQYPYIGCPACRKWRLNDAVRPCKSRLRVIADMTRYKLLPTKRQEAPGRSPSPTMLTSNADPAPVHRVCVPLFEIFSGFVFFKLWLYNTHILKLLPSFNVYIREEGIKRNLRPQEFYQRSPVF